MSNPHEDFDRFLAGAKRGARNAHDAKTDSAADAPSPAFATRVAAVWVAEESAPWWLAPLNRAAPWAFVSLVAVVVCVAAICRHDYGAGARLADAMSGLVAEDTGSSPF